MSKKAIVYWISTALICLVTLGGGFADLTHHPEAMKLIVEGLGYPEFVLTLLGIWKLLAVPALLIPDFPRLKEFAYAGLFFDFSGALFSHISLGQGPEIWGILPVLLVLLALSYFLRPEGRKL